MDAKVLSVMEWTILTKLAQSFPPELFYLFAEAINEKENPLKDANQTATATSVYPSVFPVSGGLDSTAFWLLEKGGCSRSKCLYFDFSQPYGQQEIDTLERLGIQPDIITIAFPFYSWEHIIPGRNLFILLTCAEYTAQNGEIFFAVTKGEHPITGGDKSQIFVAGVEHYIGRSISVRTLANYTKSQLVKLLMGGYKDDLLQTLSCFQPTVGEGLHCGKCQACLRHYIAFENNGLGAELLATRYVSNPLDDNPAVLKYREAMKSELMYPDSTTYGRERAIETLSVIGQDILNELGVPLWKNTTF